MVKKKKRQRKQIEWVHFGAAVIDTEISVDSCINHEVSDRRCRHSGLPIYDSKKYMSVRAVVIWDEDQVGEEVWFHFYQMESGRQKLILDDLHLKNKRTGERRFRTYRGEKLPAYGEPDPIGYLRKSGKTEQDKQRWYGHCDMTPEAMKTAMMILLSPKQSYLHVVGKPGRKLVTLIRASVSLGDPGDWEEFDRLKEQIALRQSLFC